MGYGFPEGKKSGGLNCITGVEASLLYRFLFDLHKLSTKVSDA